MKVTMWENINTNILTNISRNKKTFNVVIIILYKSIFMIDIDENLLRPFDEVIQSMIDEISLGGIFLKGILLISK